MKIDIWSSNKLFWKYEFFWGKDFFWELYLYLLDIGTVFMSANANKQDEVADSWDWSFTLQNLCFCLLIWEMSSNGGWNKWSERKFYLFISEEVHLTSENISMFIQTKYKPVTWHFFVLTKGQLLYWQKSNWRKATSDLPVAICEKFWLCTFSKLKFLVQQIIFTECSL